MYVMNAVVMFDYKRNIRHAFHVILKEEGGFKSGCLYRGLVPTLMVYSIIVYIL